MKRNTKGLTRKLAALGLASALVLSMSAAALAEATTTDATTAATATAAATLTNEEKQQARQAARSTYDAAVDEVLTEMVTAGALTQEAVDSYHALRDAERLVEQIDTSSWTLDQVTAFRQAISGSGVNETTLAGLISQGALTQADADAIKKAYDSDRVTLTALINKVDTSKATQAMITQLQDARKAYAQALADAGIVSGIGNARGGVGTGSRGNWPATGFQGNGRNRGRGGK